MAFDAFLTFYGTANSPAGNITISGESNDPNHPNAIQIKAFDFGIENITSIGSASGGAGAGKAKLDPFKFMKSVDKSSPVFLLLIGTGGHFSKVTLALRKSGGIQSDYVLYTFGTVYAISQEITGSAGDDVPSETIQLAYGSLKVEYQIQNAAGQFTGTATGSWNQINNSP